MEVTGNVAQVDTTSAVLGKVENERMINDLPLVDRDTLQLGLLQAGVFPADPDDTSGNPFSVSGQRSESLTFLLDGANNTDFLGNNIVVSPNPDAVEEFKILTNNYDAQYGRTSGGIVNQITKSGTNDFHGDAFEFLRNNVLNARDYFLPPSQPKAAFRRNVVWWNIGWADKERQGVLLSSPIKAPARREGTRLTKLTVINPGRAHRRTSGIFFRVRRLWELPAIAISNGGTQPVNPIQEQHPFNDMRASGLGPNGSSESGDRKLHH